MLLVPLDQHFLFYVDMCLNEGNGFMTHIFLVKLQSVSITIPKYPNVELSCFISQKFIPLIMFSQDLEESNLLYNFFRFLLLGMLTIIRGSTICEIHIQKVSKVDDVRSIYSSKWTALDIEGIHSRCCWQLVWSYKCMKNQVVGPIACKFFV